MNSELSTTNRERIVKTLNGWVILPLVILLFFGALALLIYSIVAGVRGEGHPIWSLFVLSLLLQPVWIITLVGFFTLQPNEARVLVLFGEYKGTVRTSGFHWGNPFYTNGYQQVGGLTVGGEIQSKLTGTKTGAGASSRQTMGRNKMSLRA